MKNSKIKKTILSQLMIEPGKKIFLGVFLFLIFFLVFKGIFVTSWGPSSNYENVSVHTTVNVTNAYHEIIDITCNNGTDITLTAGGAYTLSCLVEIRDYNGGSDVN